MKLEVDKDEIFNDELVDEYFADDSGSFYYHPSLTLSRSLSYSLSLTLSLCLSALSFSQNNLCEFTTQEHKFKRCFCTQKLVLNVRFKDFLCTKISMSQKYILI